MKLRIKISKHHSSYLGQISLQIMLLPILIRFLNSLRKNDAEDKVEAKGLGSPVIDDCTQL